MTNATEELRRLLDERGVHWWEGEDERKTLWKSNGLTWEYFNSEGGDARLGFLGACEVDITPEQAIAATLGNSKSSADAIAELRKVVREAFSRESVSMLVEGHTIMRAIDAVETATLGNDEPPYDELLHCLENDWHISASWDGLRKFWCIELTEEGTLTAERVREVIEKRFDFDVWVPKERWQAIADELNARTCDQCERTCHDTWDTELTGRLRFQCSECGAVSLEITPRHCPNCGAEVVKP